jgi:hypothetical protein
MLPALQAGELTADPTLRAVRVFGPVAVVHYEGHTPDLGEARSGAQP